MIIATKRSFYGLESRQAAGGTPNTTSDPHPLQNGQSQHTLAFIGIRLGIVLLFKIDSVHN